MISTQSTAHPVRQSRIRYIGIDRYVNLHTHDVHTCVQERPDETGILDEYFIWCMLINMCAICIQAWLLLWFKTFDLIYTSILRCLVWIYRHFVNYGPHDSLIYEVISSILKIKFRIYVCVYTMYIYMYMYVAFITSLLFLIYIYIYIYMRQTKS